MKFIDPCDYSRTLAGRRTISKIDADVSQRIFIDQRDYSRTLAGGRTFPQINDDVLQRIFMDPSEQRV